MKNERYNLEIAKREALEQNFLQQIEQRLLLHSHTVWGHGTTTKEVAEKILKSGILVNPGYGLLEIAVPLTDSSKSLAENGKMILDSVSKWPHKEAKFVVMIEMPDGYKKDQLVESVMIEGMERIRLPNRFIKCYIDAINLSIIENPDFQESATPTAAFPYEILPQKPQQKKDPPPLPSTSVDGESEIW